MWIGRWSEESSCVVFHVVLSAMSGEVSDMSGDVGFVLMLYGLLVGRCVMLSMTCECSCCDMSVPLVSVCCASHVRWGR